MAEHYFTKRPHSSSRATRIVTLIQQRRFHFESSAGVFSRTRIDPGTLALVEFMQLPAEGTVLDLGCGIGVVGIVVKSFHSLLSVCLSDVNERAIRLAQQNAALNNVSVEIRSGEGLAPWNRQFDAILLNPPQHAGKEICFRLMTEAQCRLKTGGSLQIVVRRNKGGKSFSEQMELIFGNVTEMGKKKGYGVYRSIKREN